MAELTVAMVYGNALFAASKELNKIDLIKEDINQTLLIFNTNSEFMEILDSPAISTKNKKKLINDVFLGNMCEELLSFLCILIDKDRMHEFPRIVRYYNQLVDADEGFAAGKIYSVMPLSEKQINGFEIETGKLIKDKVKLTNEIDSSLIGGISVLINEKLIDASFKGRLKNLIYEIKNN